MKMRVVLAIIVQMLILAEALNDGFEKKHNRTTCPQPFCVCKVRRKSAICTGERTVLAYIPRLPRYVNHATFRSTNYFNMTRQFLSNLTIYDITRLHFVRTNTTDIEPDAFNDLTNLTTLEISDNVNLKPTVVSNVLRRIVALDRAIFKSNNWVNIPKDMFTGFRHSTITQLSLENNDISVIGGQYFAGLHVLNELDLSHNKLSNFDSTGFEFTKITHLNLAFNHLQEIPSFCGPSGVETGRYTSINLTANPILSLDQLSSKCLNFLWKLILDQTTLRVIKKNTFTHLPRLESLSLKKVGDRLINVQPNAFNSSTLQKLIFTQNNYRFDKKPSPFVFESLPKLVTLDLTNNYLPSKANKLNRMFGNLRNLRRFILQSADLFDLPKNLFQRMPNITQLVLNGNRISGWNDDPAVFENVTSIRELFLEGNNIKLVNKTSFPSSFLQSLTKFSFSDNPFSCTCELVWFLNWMKSTNTSNVVYNKRYKCLYPPELNGKLVSDYNPTELECSPVDKLLEYVCIGISLTFIVTTIVVIIGYRYRFYLRYWLHILGLHRMGYQRIEDDADYQYDAFVIYCHEDTHFVMEEMIPELEEKAHCRLCVHSRDFDVGRFILDNITANIQLSRNVILVLSRAFLDSEWCRYELTLIQTRLIQEGPGVLTVILLEEMEVGILPSSIRSILDTVTYNEWPKDEAGRRRFWGRLLIALNKRLEINEEVM
ncbi:toll-like receptor 13 isoform X2 [Mizuhopecten yessoensis]|nr:toll-like receptor 13 isoform X2 [Mizuhopecten yessoensis]